MRHGPWIFGVSTALALLLALPGCEGSGPSFNLSSRPAAPGDSLTIRRVMGDQASVERVDNDTALGWIEPEAPRSTLGNPDDAVRNIPEYRPVPRPDLEREGRPRAQAPRGSSSAPPDSTITEQRIPGPSRVDAFAPPASATPDPNRAGQVLAVPGGPPAVLGVGSGGQTPYTRAGQPGGVAVDNGSGAVTLLGADGSIRVVPR
ncbi:hypothetical protein [Plastoroseomonas arctica]|uniref:Uncharacterized protein n=1 Tax=Plastoroseomonas arctica TaxID=1509237 RepID=A0AAF1JZG0_9PROT|nr:hypothetical protein [Plastoroseomonas arctica]MBR0654273.1 hypothetical protein [Plastoroseomonas arctica]